MVRAKIIISRLNSRIYLKSQPNKMKYHPYGQTEKKPIATNPYWEGQKKEAEAALEAMDVSLKGQRNGMS